MELAKAKSFILKNAKAFILICQSHPLKLMAVVIIL
jgi:hypothetical protein